LGRDDGRKENRSTEIRAVTQSLKLGLRSRERPVTPTTPATTNPAATRCAYEMKVLVVVAKLIVLCVVTGGASGGYSGGSSIDDGGV
jgi:hypothetical protein